MKKNKGSFKRRRKWVIIGSFLLFLFILSEFYLRSYWGFCDSVLMMESKKYEYIAQPNQNRFRFRNNIQYNSYSMRSPEPDSIAVTILGFGDSIINGGVMVDQDSLATTRLSKDLTKELGTKVQVLNIGAGSWGPDNDFAYLNEKGDFNAKAFFLVVSSHDAFDNMDFTPLIDKVIRYESKQYKLAIWELIDKYLIPRLQKHLPSEDIGVFKKGAEFNSGFLDFYEYCQRKDLPFFIYLNADKYELAANKYNSDGQLIIDFCETNNIPLIRGIETTEPEDYRGVIHMNNQGQRHMAKAIYPTLNSILKQID